MMQPIGGYFSLELNGGVERHAKALRLNSGRYALEYILKARKYRKLYIPYYICDSVMEPIKRQHVDYEFYHINEQLEPAVALHPKDDEAVLYVNYFGLKSRYASAFCHAYRNTIIDSTQAFYSEPGSNCGDPNVQCDTFYSCRKFFGVPDGAYLYTDCHLSEELPLDESYERFTFLTKRIDRSPQEAFADFHANGEALAGAGMRRMSRLTEQMMGSIDYSAKANRRICKFRLLDKALRGSNLLKVNLDDASVPLIYPYLVEDGARLRQYLIDHQVFCARYWPNVLEWCQPDDWEYRLAEDMVCLPIDQRYGEEEMRFILDLFGCFK